MEERDQSQLIRRPFSLTYIKKGINLTYERKFLGNGLYLFVINGEGEFNGQKFSTRDGIALKDFEKVVISAAIDAELLLMEVPVKNLTHPHFMTIGKRTLFSI